MKKFSIITINYNNKEGLSKTFQNVFNQTFKEFEYIVIDGNSNDGSKELIQQNNRNIDSWVSEPDQGIYNALNKGVLKSNGEYLIFMNSGDCFYELNTLEKINEYVTNHMIYYGNSYEINPGRLLTYPEPLQFSFFLERTLAHQATITKKEVFDKYFLFNESCSVHGDWEFFIRAICKQSLSHKYLPFTICNYEGGGISTTYNDEIGNERRRVLKKYFPAFKLDYEYYHESKYLNKQLRRIGLIQLLKKFIAFKHI